MSYNLFEDFPYPIHHDHAQSKIFVRPTSKVHTGPLKVSTKNNILNLRRA